MLYIRHMDGEPNRLDLSSSEDMVNLVIWNEVTYYKNYHPSSPWRFAYRSWDIVSFNGRHHLSHCVTDLNAGRYNNVNLINDPYCAGIYIWNRRLYLRLYTPSGIIYSRMIRGITDSSYTSYGTLKKCMKSLAMQMCIMKRTKLYKLSTQNVDSKYMSLLEEFSVLQLIGVQRHYNI